MEHPRRHARVMVEPNVLAAIFQEAVATGLPPTAEFRGMRSMPFGGFEILFEDESFEPVPIGQPPRTLAVTFKVGARG